MRDDVIIEFASRFRRDSILLDSNLLLPFVGLGLGIGEFSKLKRAELSFREALLLRALVLKYRAVATTPSILAETSNLAQMAPATTAGLFRGLLAKWLAGAAEVFERGVVIVEHDSYARLGFTDATAAVLSAANHVVVTVDVQLYLEMEAHGLPCLNFGHLRARLVTG